MPIASVSSADALRREAVLVLGVEVDELGNEHLALLAEGAGDEGDLTALRDVAGHGDAVPDRLVVGMSVDEHQPAVGRGNHAITLGAHKQPSAPVTTANYP